MPIENEDGFLFYYGDTFLGEVSNLKITADPPLSEDKVSWNRAPVDSWTAWDRADGDSWSVNSKKLSTKDEAWPRCHICGNFADPGNWFHDEFICRPCQIAVVARAVPVEKWFPWTK